MKDWNDIKKEVLGLASSHRLLPFLGSTISHFHPTGLPLGAGLLHCALQGAFPERNLFHLPRDLWSDDERAFAEHSPEVILQGLAEALPDREKLSVLYNKMCGLEPNPFHRLIAGALVNRLVPTVFTTNQDQCIETAASKISPIEPIYDELGFEKGLQPTLYQFHGAVGGQTSMEINRRKNSLIFTLHGMGPSLSVNKSSVLAQALAHYPILFLGYSGSDPNLWYALSAILERNPRHSIFWCVHRGPSSHLARLWSQNPKHIVVFKGDILDILPELGRAWGLPDCSCVRPEEDLQEQRRENLRSWAEGLTSEQRGLAYGWLLVSVGRYRSAAIHLDRIAESASDANVQILASLFAGYACRELSDHITARNHLRNAMTKSKSSDPCRYAQAAHKYGESQSAFESVRFWHLWPTRAWTHGGAKWLNRAIELYQDGARLPLNEMDKKQFSRSGLGTAKMNLGQLYRRSAAYLPRPKLRECARQLIKGAIQLLEYEKDLRSLPMAVAAAACDDQEMTDTEILQKLDLAIEYSVHWNQDKIQIGAAYFAKGNFLASKSPDESANCFWKALDEFQKADMKAEVARTELEFASVLARKARMTIAQTQGSWEWKIGIRILSIWKFIKALFIS